MVDAVEKRWVWGWARKGFQGKKNPDLWMRFLRIYNQHRVRFVWVKGHAETVENNRCDQLQVKTSWKIVVICPNRGPGLHKRKLFAIFGS